MGIISGIEELLLFFVGIYAGINFVITQILGLVIGILSLGYEILSQLTSVYSVLFIDAWTSIIMLGVTFTIYMRVYYYVKGISIFGFKIG